MKKTNPVVWFEIPALDLDRATKFYNKIFGYEFSFRSIDGNDMAFFPSDWGKNGTSGALVKGDIYKPSKEGVLIYFMMDEIPPILEKVQAEGNAILYPFTSIGENGFCAEFEDSEGNRIGLYQNPNE